MFKENPKKKLIPNRFYYALPPDLIDEKDIPDYAGLIIVNGSHATIVKRAPFIHKVKYDFRKILCDKFYYLWLNQKRKLNHIEYELESANSKISTLSIRQFTAEKKKWRIKTIDYPNKLVTGEADAQWDKKLMKHIDEKETKQFNFKDVKFQ